jgi:hypothetical protein
MDQGTLFLVHGTGVRAQAYDASVDRIQRRALANGIRAHVVGCYWGDMHEVAADAITRSLPPARSLEPVPEAQHMDSADEWGVLLDDPLIELRLAAAGSPTTPREPVVGSNPPAQAAVDALNRLGAHIDPQRLGGLAPAEVTHAAVIVGRSAALRECARAAGSAREPHLIELAARAVVAQALAVYAEDPDTPAPISATVQVARDELLEAVRDALGPPAQALAVPSWIRKPAAGLAARTSTSYLRRRRYSAGVTSLASQTIGDILYYQRRGEGIRELVRQQIATVRPPVVALGHSLGGIILADVLSDKPPASVRCLVTVGSQVPLFWAIDALHRPKADFAPFEPWLNIYNPRDFLSFVAAPSFPHNSRLRDIEIDPGIPFPFAHSAYFDQDTTYRMVAGFWKEYGRA